MTKRNNRQLELPILSDVNSKKVSNVDSLNLQQKNPMVNSGFHKNASAEDLSIYNTISESYLTNLVK